MLAIVEDEQQVAVGEDHGQRFLRWSAGGELRPKRSRDGVRNLRTLGDRGKLHPPAPVGEFAVARYRGCQRHARLADAGGADDRYDRVLSQQRLHGVQVLRAPEQRRRRREVAGDTYRRQRRLI